MTPDQAEAIVARIAATFRGRLSNTVRETWTDALSDLDHQAAVAAVDQLARTESRMPSIAAVRQAAAGRTPDPGDFQVLVSWRDSEGRVFAEPRRWHQSESDAWADYHACVADWPVATEWGVTLFRHRSDRPVEELAAINVERTLRALS